MKFIGIDLGWTRAKKRTAVAILDESCRLISIENITTDDEIIKGITKFSDEGSIIGIDAPLVVPNEDGNRVPEVILSKIGVNIYPVSRSLFQRQFGCIRGEELVKKLKTFGFLLVDYIEKKTRAKVIMEVCPYVSMRALFDNIPKYKKGKLEKRQTEIVKLIEQLTSDALSPKIDLSMCSEFIKNIPSKKRKELDQISDAIDAIVAAYTVFLHWMTSDRTDVIGTEPDGFILTILNDEMREKLASVQGLEVKPKTEIETAIKPRPEEATDEMGLSERKLGIDKCIILSDIHSNLEALEVVLKYAKEKDIERVFCLGDIIGYGPNPIECIDKAMDFEVNLLGNHEYAVLERAIGFNVIADAAIKWTRKKIKPGIFSFAKKKRWNFIKSLPKSFKIDSLLLVHGSPQNPVDEYLLVSDVDEITGEFSRKLKEAFKETKWVTFVGHTHFPVVFIESGKVFTSGAIEGSLEFKKEQKYIVNVGSVGQPRDRDPRACFVVLEQNKISFVRLEYDISKTQAKIEKIAMLDKRLGERLATGS